MTCKKQEYERVEEVEENKCNRIVKQKPQHGRDVGFPGVSSNCDLRLSVNLVLR